MARTLRWLSRLVHAIAPCPYLPPLHAAHDFEVILGVHVAVPAQLNLHLVASPAVQRAARVHSLRRHANNDAVNNALQPLRLGPHLQDRLHIVCAILPCMHLHDHTSMHACMTMLRHRSKCNWGEHMNP